MATETLQALVARRKHELDRSYREMAAQAKGLVSHGTLQKIATGEHVGRLTDDVLTGIALAIDLPASTVREASGAAPTYGALRLPQRAERLTPVQRKALTAIIDAFLDAQEGEHK